MQYDLRLEVFVKPIKILCHGQGKLYGYTNYRLHMCLIKRDIKMYMDLHSVQKRKNTEQKLKYSWLTSVPGGPIGPCNPLGPDWP